MGRRAWSSLSAIGFAVVALLAAPGPVALADHPAAADGDVPASVEAALGGEVSELPSGLYEVDPPRGGGAAPPPLALALQNRQPVSDTAAPAGGWRLYTIKVPRHRSRLSVTLDCAELCPDELDLYLRREVEPNVAEFDCRSATPGSDEVCKVHKPRKGSWHIGIHTVDGGGGSAFELTARLRR